jgi:hypothetical protein
LKGYHGELWSEQCSNGAKRIEKELRNEMIEENTDVIKMEELNSVLKHAKNKKRPKYAKNKKRPVLGNLLMELLKFVGSELRLHILEQFNNRVDKIQIPKNGKQELL